MNPISYLLIKMWHYSKGNRGSVVLYSVLFVISNMIYFLEPLVIARILDIVQLQGLNAETFPVLLTYLAYLPLLTLGFWLFHGVGRQIELQNAFLVKANFKRFLVDTVLSYPLEWHTNHHSGDSIDKIEKGSTALNRFSSETFQIIGAIIPFISSYLALSYFNIHSAYIVLLCITFTVVIILKFDVVLEKQYKELNHSDNTISAKIFDVISNITTVVILRIQELVGQTIWQKIMFPYPFYKRNIRLNEIKWFLVGVLSMVMNVGVLGTYLVMSFHNGHVVMLGTFAALYGYVGRISELFYRFAYMYGDILQQRSAVLNAQELLVYVPNQLPVLTTPRSRHSWRVIRLENIEFSYETLDGGALHLNSISMNIARGAKIALIGASGSGKTTFLKVLRELYTLQKGLVYVDGKLLQGGLSEISSEIALIPQDPEIFSTTIRENITVGIEHSEDFMRHFTDMACFTEVLNRLPHGLESLIYEKGVNLSGGERQRLALARGLMASQDKSILLLDESTSSVDTKNELAIYQNIFTKFSDKTIIASIHRLHLLSQFDEIYFFKKGRIIAQGSLAELLKASTEFKELWDKYHKAVEGDLVVKN